MTFIWSKNAPYLQWLDAAWRSSDGFSEEDLHNAETRLGIQLPTVLRGFYRYWGDRHQVHESLEGLATPDELFMQSGALIFVFENQGVFVRGIQWQDLMLTDPPVYSAYNDWDAPAPATLNWRRTHEHVSDYLDALTVLHAGRYGIYSAYQDQRKLATPLPWYPIRIHSIPLYFHIDAMPPEWIVFVQEDGTYFDPWVHGTRRTRD